MRLQLGGASSHWDVVLGMHAKNLLSGERDCMVYVRRLKERQNVIKMFLGKRPVSLQPSILKYNGISLINGSYGYCQNRFVPR